MADNRLYTEAEKARFRAIENITGISKDFYDDVYEASKALRDFRNEIRYNGRVLEKLHSLPPMSEEDMEVKLDIFLTADAYKCFQEMGISLDTDTKEYFGLFLYTASLMSDNRLMPYESIIKYEKIIANHVNFLSGMGIVLKELKDPQGLLVSMILPTVELIQKYKVLLYRWASLVAKADGVITEQEQVWLASIMAVQKPRYEDARENENAIPDVVTSERSHAENPLDRLNKMIGLHGVKQEIETLYNYVKIQKQREGLGLKATPVSYHCVFTGNAGTGKTTVARIVAHIYKELGVLKKGHLVETDRSGLVAEYVGQTAVKTNKIIDSALDGVLFVDEAYSLSEGGQGDYGKEAIATLIKRMEDDRARLVVILAGYGSNMKEFLKSNIGLQSRFSRYIDFPDYSADELFEIFMLSAAKYEYKLTEAAQQQLRTIFIKALNEKDASFGNGRFVRNLFEKTIERQANRLAKAPQVTPEILSTIEAEDIWDH